MQVNYPQSGQTSGGTPRSGVKRENEERKKELNRMREEAKAKRALEGVSEPNSDFLWLMSST